MRHLKLIDETDSRFEERERKLMLGRLSGNSGGAKVVDFDPHDRGAGRHSLEAHRSGEAAGEGIANLGGQSPGEKKMRIGNPQGTGDEEDTGIEQQGIDDENSDEEDDFTREAHAVKRWVKSRQKQLMQILNDDEDALLGARTETLKSAAATSQRAVTRSTIWRSVCCGCGLQGAKRLFLHMPAGGTAATRSKI